ncbi:MAG TPA: hypothetical protein VF943_11775 [Burkholderiales bacterium]
MTLRRAILVLLVAVLGGCAGLERAPGGGAYASTEARECVDWFQAIDGEIDAAATRDAQDHRVAGFPYLRVNRLLASYRGEARESERVLQALAERMQALDLAARRHEIANLPPARLPAPPGASLAEARSLALRRAQDCGRLLRDADLASPTRRHALLDGAAVPDDYSTASRVAGLYAIAKWPFSRGVRRYQEEVRADFARELAPPPGGWTVRFAPPVVDADRAAVAALLSRAADDPLGIPEPSPRELHALFAAYAPSFDIDITGDFDRFGELRWRRGSAVPVVDSSFAAVYVNLAWTRYRGRALLQLVYTLWFPERPAAGSLDLLAGKLDGLTWRVTLAPDGEPLVYDSIHPCGCYHLFVPTSGAEPLPEPPGEVEWAFIPQRLPALAPGERPLLRIATRTHYIDRVLTVRGADSLVRYEMHPYDELRSLADGGGRRSIFGPDGLVAGTERAERFFFWPMGIASAGAMRQWGHQATAFVGRRHFDDADLLESRFRLAIPEARR